MHQSADWVQGHFARIIEPRARRVLRASAQEIDTMAFDNPDGSAAVVASSRREQTLRFALCIDGVGGAVVLPPQSVATFVSSAS